MDHRSPYGTAETIVGKVGEGQGHRFPSNRAMGKLVDLLLPKTLLIESRS